jgi:hypothetical protein
MFIGLVRINVIGTIVFVLCVYSLCVPPRSLRLCGKIFNRRDAERA